MSKPAIRQGKLTRELPPFADDDEVLNFRQWITLNGIGARTGRRILKSDNRPVITMLSARRLGITKRANRIWQQSRERR
jgi:hypothetical protein